ncbi:MAG: peptidase and in kexin sedolisin [Streptosporangiaceae bacterium]|jgi:subtilisin family serine protease|nr:peptidase and in kexin sedolisin [Streptosporangiaceae bacterium]
MRTWARKGLIVVAAAVPVALATTLPAHAAVAAPHVPVTMAAHGHGVSGQYIVTLKKDASVSKTVSQTRVPTLYRYGKVLNGFTAKLTAAQLDRVRGNPDVAAIEQDQVMHTDTTQSGPTWGLDRIDQASLPLSSSYTYNTTASNVYAYVIDTGISTGHSDFGGRAAVAYDAIGGNGQDCNGHGTHVAGTIGGAKYGVAKGVKLRAVRVLDCNGSGTNSGVIAGMNWVASNHSSPAVANMSLGGGYSSSVNSAANNLASSGVFLAVAAGNSNADACNSSPSSAANTTTVAASDSTDTRASFSNYGGCVDLYAPGVNITSDWLNGGTNTISGTSMATPHVVGVGALYKATYGDASYSTIRSWLTTNASSGKIISNPSGTPNRLLNKSSL